MRLMPQNGTPDVRTSKPRLSDNVKPKQDSSSPSSDKENDSGSTDVITVTLGVDKVPFTLGSSVLARWLDELFYPAILLQVNAKDEVCTVQFDDGSKTAVMATNVQWPTLDADRELRCSLCHQLHSKPPNQIVICDDCGLGFHQRCHHPLISEDTLKADADWFCVLCVLKKQQQLKVHGAKSNSKMCRPKEKRSYPYQLSSLHWTENHCQNQEKKYCYCGGQGQWYLKMVQCIRCKQWFHEACLSAKAPRPQSCGDTLYLFLCCMCNNGYELLHRIDLRWADIAHIALFNLSLGRGKYVDFDTDLMPWINDRWDRLNVGKLQSVALGERFMLILRALREDQVKFKNGAETKKRAAWYALRVRAPPFVPAVSLPTDQRSLTPAVLRDWLAHTNRICHLPPSSVAVTIPSLLSKSVPVKKRKRTDSDAEDAAQEPLNKRKRITASTPSAPPTPTLNGTHLKPKHKKSKDAPTTPSSSRSSSTSRASSTSKSSTPSSKSSTEPEPETETETDVKLKRKARRKWTSLLDREIPAPTDFTGINNPFLYPAERDMISDRFTARTQIFNTFTRGLPGLQVGLTMTSGTLVNGSNGHCQNTDTTSTDSGYSGRSSSNGLRRRGSINGLGESSASTASTVNSLERCVYEGDVLEWDEFQVRALRRLEDGEGEGGTGGSGGMGGDGCRVQMFTEYYADMPELKMKL